LTLTLPPLGVKAPRKGLEKEEKLQFVGRLRKENYEGEKRRLVSGRGGTTDNVPPLLWKLSHQEFTRLLA